MKAFFIDHIVDIILGIGLSSTTHPAWPGFASEQDRWSKIEADKKLISCRKENDRQE